MLEKFFSCPYCWQEISMILDEYDEQPSYIEDCEVCCRPIEIVYTLQEGELLHFQARPMDGIQ